MLKQIKTQHDEAAPVTAKVDHESLFSSGNGNIQKSLNNVLE